MRTKTETTGPVAQLVQHWLIHHYGTNDRQVMRDEFGVGAKMVSEDTVELMEFVQPGHSTTHWLFEDVVTALNQFIMAQSPVTPPPLKATLTNYFLIRVRHKYTDVRVRIRLEVADGA